VSGWFCQLRLHSRAEGRGSHSAAFFDVRFNYPDVARMTTQRSVYCDRFARQRVGGSSDTIGSNWIEPASRAGSIIDLADS
jgi:hypothetical protein